MNWKPSLVPIPAMTNTERQRKFRENNPGYYSRLRNKRLPAVAPLPSRAALLSSAAVATHPTPSLVSPSIEFTLAAMAA